MKKKNPAKRKSDLIFWGVALGIIAFLFLTPWGFKVQSYLRSMLIWSPNVEENTVTDSSSQSLGIDWMLISDKGENVYISDFDKPIFLNFWATWCAPCRGEMPSIVDLREKYGDKVDFLLVSPSDNLDKVLTAKQDEGWDFTLYINASKIPNNLEFEVFPTTYVIDKNKQIRYKFEGAYNWDSEDVYKLLDQLIAE